MGENDSTPKASILNKFHKKDDVQSVSDLIGPQDSGSEGFIVRVNDPIPRLKDLQHAYKLKGDLEAYKKISERISVIEEDRALEQIRLAQIFIEE